MRYVRAQLTADLSVGAGMALGFTAIAALPLGGLGLINFVEMVRGRALELPWGAYWVVAAVVPGSYFYSDRFAHRSLVGFSQGSRSV